MVSTVGPLRAQRPLFLQARPAPSLDFPAARAHHRVVVGDTESSALA